MRATTAALLCGVVSVSALNIPRQAPPDPTGVPQPATSAIIFQTHTWPLLSPSEALSSLAAKASATPSAVSLMPGVQLPADIMEKIEHVVDQVEGEWEHMTEAFAEAKKSKDAANGVAVDATSCSNPAVRYEWSYLTDQHKSEYVEAIKCLTEKETHLHCAPCNTVFDDLIYIHQQMNLNIHAVGQFLPWHRYFLWIFENLLSSECGYDGPLGWLDWTKYSGQFQNAPPFTPTYEGHLPVDSNPVCITEGVFANMVVPIGPGATETRHCLARGLDNSLSAAVTENFVNQCNSYTDFNDMQSCQFYGPHAYVHDACGGIMSDVASSPGDPLFYLHHAFVDRNWRIWQNVNSARYTAIGGWTTQTCETNNGGSGCQETTLSYTLSSMGLAPSYPISDFIYTEGGELCYKYNY